MTKMLYLKIKVDVDTINWGYFLQRIQRFSKVRNVLLVLHFKVFFTMSFLDFSHDKVAYLIRQIVSELKVLIEGLGGFTV